jgi:hypothetical protein
MAPRLINLSVPRKFLLRRFDKRMRLSFIRFFVGQTLLIRAVR